MPDVADGEREPRGGHTRRLIEALYSPNSYGSVLVLLFITYGLSVSLTTQTWAASLVLAVQIATVVIILRTSQATRSLRVFADVALVISSGTVR